MPSVFLSLWAIKMTPLISFSWWAWLKFIYLQFIAISGRIQWNGRGGGGNFNFQLLSFIRYATEPLELPFSVASLLSEQNTKIAPCPSPPRTLPWRLSCVHFTRITEQTTLPSVPGSVLPSTSLFYIMLICVAWSDKYSEKVSLVRETWIIPIDSKRVLQILSYLYLYLFLYIQIDDR